MQIKYHELPIPTGWTKEKIGSRLKLNYGKSQATIKTDDGTIPIFGTGGLMGYGNRALTDGDSVLLGRKGTLGNPLYIEQPFWPVDTTYYTSDFDGSMKWFYYLAQTIGLSSLNEATGVPSLSRQTFYNVEVLFPPPEEQTAIADILSTVDQVIAQTEALIAKQRRIKAGLLHDLLTRGIDEHGQLRDPATHRFKQTAVGWAPEEWEVKRVKDICLLGRGRVISQMEIDSHPGNYSVYSSQSKDEGIMGAIDTFDFDGEYVTWTTDGAYAGTVFFRSGQFNCTNVCGTLKAISHAVNMRFLALALSRVTKKHVSYVGNPKLMNNIMAEIQMALPCKAEQEAISLYLVKIDQHVQDEQARLTKLKRLKTGLMQDLLSGRVSVAGMVATLPA